MYICQLHTPLELDHDCVCSEIGNLAILCLPVISLLYFGSRLTAFLARLALVKLASLFTARSSVPSFPRDQLRTRSQCSPHSLFPA
ncbi:hypothetical protein BDV98DRAFT_576828 [Pterulicium gracile]|uniref:Uncharacterized protein n=1 Tax=Pterulicium gracile TaxID=1884261 RepID=A0A5C3Q229_9AGAR|nr:hypothetical protein BDV98DRAFT_576828 [Pterula gracilis]